MLLTKSRAFYLLASIVVSFLAGSSAPTPLYEVYQAAWGLSPIAITVAFGVYALAVLCALLVLGRLSDHVGRRPVLIVAALSQAAAMLMFATAANLSDLILARIVQGISAGAALGAVGAGMLDIDRAKGAIANAVGPMSGTAIGGIVSGVFVQYFVFPRHLIYILFSTIFLLQALGVVLMPESVSRKSGALGALRPQFRLPTAVRAPMVLAMPTLVAVWALGGFYGSLGPMLVRQLSGGASPLLGGLALCVLAASGALAVLHLRAREPHILMRYGAAALLLGVTVTLAAISVGTLAGFFLGTALAGVGFGAGFQGAIRSVVPLAEAHERAGVLSVLYVVSYSGMGAPAVLAGVGLAHGGAVYRTTWEYGIAVMVLAAGALIGTFTRRRTAATAPVPSQSAPASATYRSY